MRGWEIVIYLLILIIATVLGGGTGLILAIAFMHVLLNYRRTEHSSTHTTPTEKHEVELTYQPISTEPVNIEQTPTYRRWLYVPPHLQANYRAYLDSPEWPKLRQQVFKRDNHTCVRCGYIGPKKQAHHTHYTGIEDMNFSIDQLETVCIQCHEAIHRGELPMQKD